MIDKKSIMKMANDVFHRSQGYPDRRLLHPQRDWGIGLVVFAVVVISGSVLVGNIFVQYRGVNAIAGESKESILQYRESVVEDALELYHAREEAYKRLRGSVAVTPVLEVASSSVATSTEEI